jgi:D-sedoheptulose 7-phosphate isomerase
VTIERTFEEHERVVAASRALAPKARDAAALVVGALRAGNKVLACGNGGSAADAQHFAAELVGRYAQERAALPAIALTTDTSALTAIANDYSYEQVFARQLRALGHKGDAVLLLSTSGRSPNVLAAARAARELGCRTVAFTGQGGALVAELADVALVVPSADVARIQEVHELLLHALAHEIESTLFPDTLPSP